MDKSYDGSKSEGSSDEEWMDLSKSDYAKVIFSNLYWNSATGDVGCYFSLTETVCKNPSDYIGIYRVGYDNLSQCLAMKKLSEFKSEDDSKPIHCGFKSEELPELNGFYQFKYVTHENEVCGASMPFEVKLAQKKVASLEEVVTERIENDFLMVRYGLEQKNCKLETLLKTYEAENVVLVARIKELRAEKAALTQKLEANQQSLKDLGEEYKQLADKHLVLTTDLESTKAKEAAALEGHMVLAKKLESATTKEAMACCAIRAAENRFCAISTELEKERKKADELLQLNRETKTKHEKAVANNKDEFEDTIRHKNAIIAELSKKYDKSREEIKDKQIAIEKMKQGNCNLITAKDLTIVECKRKILQLSYQIEKLNSELISKEKLLKNQWSGDREQKYNLMQIDLENALHHKIALEKEVMQLKRYLHNPQEYTQHSGGPITLNRLQTTDDERLVVEQLEDAKFMIKALEDSKQLAMKEMHELSEKLKKTKDELSQLKCENMALKIFFEEKASCGHSEESKYSPDKNIQAQADSVKMNLLSKLKEMDPTANMDNLEEKLMDLITNAQHQTEKINKSKAELSLLRCETMALKILLEEKASCGSSEEIAQIETLEEKENDKHSDKEIQVDNVNVLMNLLSELKELDPTIDVDNVEEKCRELVLNVQHQADEISKLKEECKSKDEEIGSLNKKLQSQQQTTLDALMNAEDKTARIVQAAELYKDLYKEKEILAKQLRKLTLQKSRSKKSSLSKAQSNSKPSFLALNIEKALTSSETTSNNSDSDTGEHVRAQILYPNLKKDENYISETPFPQAPVMVETEVKPYYECNSIDTAIDNLCAAVKEDQVYTAPSKDNSLILQPLSVEQDTHIPCLICGTSFLVTPHSNIPMMEHLEKEHNMTICPICGQMFDKSFPSKYLTFHINDHFEAE